jgi:hypothetical protein
VTLGNVLFFLSNIRFLLIFKLRKEFYWYKVLAANNKIYWQ